MSLKTGTPRADGYHMPAEWAPHERTWMLWPERPDSWRAGAEPAQTAFRAVVAAIARFEPVTVGTSQAQFLNASEQLSDIPGVTVIELSSDDVWMRDCGPTFVIDDKGSLAAVDWDFNAWGGHDGGLYPSWDIDSQVARKVAQLEGVARYATPGFVLEGGSIHVDGEGTLITTAECLLHRNRNPRLSQGEIETYLRDYLAVDTIIWLPEGMFNDETDGHVDNFCCFVAPGEVLLCWTDDAKDPNYSRCRAALEVLEASHDAKGRTLRVHTIPIPAPLYAILESEGGAIGQVPDKLGRPERLAASYVNFLIVNGGIVMPGFDDPMDAVARDTLESLFPGRQVVMVPGGEILLGGGNIHCITQQQPRPSGA
ncbi:MAG: agmatine deiminase [Haliea sp.]|nr:agmatine deiminase [Haliea sp.]